MVGDGGWCTIYGENQSLDRDRRVVYVLEIDAQPVCLGKGERAEGEDSLFVDGLQKVTWTFTPHPHPRAAPPPMRGGEILDDPGACLSSNNAR